LDSNTLDPEQLAVLYKFDRVDIGPRFSGHFRIRGNRLEFINNGTSNDIEDIQSNLSPTDFDSFIQVIGNLVSSCSIATITKMLTAFTSYFQKTGANEITIEGLSRFHELCYTHQLRHNAFGNLRSLLTHWHQLHLPGIVDDNIIDFLSKLECPKPKRPVGSRIRSDDPEEGWYTDDEFYTLVARIWSTYESKETSLYKATLLLLSAQYGRRPIQMAHLKIGDLKTADETCGVSGRRIEFPGAKDPSSVGFRQSKIEVHPVGDDLWRLCQLQARESVNQFQEFLGHRLKPGEIKLLPLFPYQSQIIFEKRMELSSEIAVSAKNMLRSEILHLNPSRLTSIIRKGPSGPPIISERTDSPLVQNAYRNRYTRTRQLARMGIPRVTLKYWMGHESPKSIEAYYDDPAERARTLNDQIAPLMAPLSQAFLGTLRDKEADAVRGDDSASRIELDEREELGIGTCGEYGFCMASVPIPCYHCINFQPWVYGPHQKVLDRLLERQKLENEVPRPGQGRRLLAPLQLNNDIKAVRTVITLCENRKKILDGSPQ
jgi:hypothetical protein